MNNSSATKYTGKKDTMMQECAIYLTTSSTAPLHSVGGQLIKYQTELLMKQY